MMRALIIYGAGGHATVVADAALASGWTIECFVDEAPRAPSLLRYPVIAAKDFSRDDPADREIIVAIGDNAARERVFNELKAAGWLMATVIHPSATISRFASVGDGVFIAGGAVINPNARVHDNCIVNTSASVDHDCAVGPHAHLCPGVHLAGNVTIGAGTMLGTGSSAIPGVRVGSRCTLGAGSVIVHDIPDAVIAEGVPARVRTVTGS